MKEGIEAAANWLVDTAKSLSGEAAQEAAQEAARKTAEETAKNFIEQVTSNNNAGETIADGIKNVMTPETAKEMVQQSSTSTVQSVVDGITANANEVKENLENLVRESDTSSWSDYLWDNMAATVTAGAATVTAPAVWFWSVKSTRDMQARVKELLNDNKPLFEMIKSSADMLKAVDKMKDKDFALTALNVLTSEQTNTLAEEGKLSSRLTELAKAKYALEFQSKLLAYKVIDKPTPETESESESDDSGLNTPNGSELPVIPSVLPVIPVEAVADPVVIEEPAQAAVTEAEIKALIATLGLDGIKATELLEKVKTVLELERYFPEEHRRAAFNVMRKDTSILLKINTCNIDQSKFEHNALKYIRENEDFRAATKSASRPPRCK